MEWKILLLRISQRQLSGSFCSSYAECLAPWWIERKMLSQATCSIAPGDHSQHTGVEDCCKGKAQQFHWGGMHSSGYTLPRDTDSCGKSRSYGSCPTAPQHNCALPGHGPALSKLSILLYSVLAFTLYLAPLCPTALQYKKVHSVARFVTSNKQHCYNSTHCFRVLK